MKIEINSFYKFHHLEAPKDVQASLLSLGKKWQLKGTTLLAHEGVNGTLSGSVEAMNELRSFLTSLPGLRDLSFKVSYWDRQPFKRFFVKVKNEIITFRGAPVDPIKETGAYVKPEVLQNWLSKKEDLLLIDTRNSFEFEAGTFSGAINPRLKSFSDFVSFVDENAKDLAKKKVVTFCTGGIRCEKATAYLLQRGVKDVYQLEGGILEYFNQTDGSHFEGDCFVFDERIAVDKNLKAVSDR